MHTEVVHDLPRLVAQTRADSCWAAVLDSWSHTRPHPFAPITQAAAIRRWAMGPTGGIAVPYVLPMIAGALGLAYAGIRGAEFEERLGKALPRGLVMCAYPVTGGVHAVLIWGFAADGSVSYMDPNAGARHRTVPLAAFAAHPGLVVVHRR